MNFDQAVQARSCDSGLYDDDLSYIVLPARIWSHRPNQRNYVIVDLEQDAEFHSAGSIGVPVWWDIFLERGQSISLTEMRIKYQKRDWYQLCDSCINSDQWKVWTMEELVRFNNQDLINDPAANRGLLVVEAQL